MKLIIDNRDLSYTVDTCQQFTLDNAYEQEHEYYTSDDAPAEFKAAGVTFDNFDDLVDVEYDNAGYLKAIAGESVDILAGEFVDRWEYVNDDGANVRVYDGIVKAIELKDIQSPQFYNYTTDSYTAIWDINPVKLKAWISKRRDEFDDFLNDNYDQYDRDYKFNKDSESYDAEYVLISMIDYYTSECYDRDQYIDEMYERVNEPAYNAIEFKLKDNKGE